MINCPRIRAILEQDLHRDFVPLSGCPMQRRETGMVFYIDVDVGLTDDYIQHSPEIRRMGDRMETAEALGVDETRVRTMLDK
jgi:hypothetical protein